MNRYSRKDFLLEVVLVALALLVLFPFYNIVVTSFKQPDELFNPLSFPHSFYLDYYKAIFEKTNYFQALGNSTMITGMTLSLLVLLASMAGYAISRAGKGPLNGIYLILVLAMIMPLQVSMVTLYKVGTQLHLINTRTFLILLYTAGAAPFSTMIYAAFTKSIPRELEEAAQIDGSSRISIFWKIVFPLLLPATGTVIVTQVMTFWNDFTGPLLFLNSKSKQTIIYLIFSFRGEHSVNWGPVFALCTLATIPIVLFFLLTQKYFFRALTSGALKG